MADVRPFRAIRPKKGLEERIAALPYDVFNSQEARREVEKEPLSFLRIDRAETAFPADFNMYDERVYQAAHDMLWEQILRGDFVQEDSDCYYLYSQTMNGRTQTGIAACASVEDYQNAVIKKHENTREEKEEDRIRHVDACDAQTGPIFLAYRANETIRSITEATMEKEPVYRFTSEDGVTHRIWVIDSGEQIEQIRKAFANTGAVYIADGHHRCASAVKVGLRRREKNPDFTGEEAYNFFLSVLFPDEELLIMDYNRVVKDLNGYQEEEFLEKLQKDFLVEKTGTEAYKPDAKGRFGMYLHGSWYCLKSREHLFSEDPVKNLDVSILQDAILNPLLGIQNPKTDKRIDFVGGIRGMKELEKRAQTDMEIAFSMFPTSIEELFAVADAGRLMPPKSTWFEPKLRSGLFIHSLKEN